MRKEFVMRGQTNSGEQEILNFSGYKPGYAYRLVEFSLYPSNGIGSGRYEITGSITASKAIAAPTDPDFSDEGLIGTSMIFAEDTNNHANLFHYTIVNDTFLITQNLILMVQDNNGSPINWQCRFVSVKMTGPEEAATNYKQFSISDG